MPPGIAGSIVMTELLPSWARRLPKHFTASGFVLRDDCILLVNHRKHRVWIYPGGHVEPDETPDEACLREIFEETGVHCRIVSPRDETCLLYTSDAADEED